MAKKPNITLASEDLPPKPYTRKEGVNAVSSVMRSIFERRRDPLDPSKPEFSNAEAKNMINGLGKLINAEVLDLEIERRDANLKKLVQPKTKKLPKSRK